MDDSINQMICQAAGCSGCQPRNVIQELWSGYGVIQKVELSGVELSGGNTRTSVPAVVKVVDLSQARANRRGWTGDVSHQRKVNSYAVEKEFYDSFSSRCPVASRVPKLLGAKQLEDGRGWVMVLEDLDAAGFPIRKHRATLEDIKSCLHWLANFHATFMDCDASGLWPIGTYWHLETRPDEFATMEDGRLKQAAAAIDSLLNRCEHQTLVHGDAKIANFCFTDQAIPTGEVSAGKVSAVDFQYAGRGCGMKDVVYFMTSCLSDEGCDREMDRLLDFYFASLRTALNNRFPDNQFPEFDQLEQQWRSMFPVAWADFNRFLIGWSPGHWKLTPFSERMTAAALRVLGSVP